MNKYQLNVWVPDSRDQDFRNFLLFLAEESYKESIKGKPNMNKIQALTYANDMFNHSIKVRADFNRQGHTPRNGGNDAA